MSPLKKESPTATNATKNGAKPEWSQRFGRVDVSVWKKEIQGKIRYSLNLSRSFRNKSGDWQRTSFFDEEDVEDLERGLDEALKFLNPPEEDKVA